MLKLLKGDRIRLQVNQKEAKCFSDLQFNGLEGIFFRYRTEEELSQNSKYDDAYISINGVLHTFPSSWCKKI